ncbi:MAG TPA: VWA domain-containing protein [Blastocatellia bacterium]|nr:VWA domain-containing protein [Blastocatellia bacterium]
MSKCRSLVCIGLILLLCLAGCKSQKEPAPAAESAQQPTPAGSLELVFTYGSEKESWIKDVTADFNRAKVKSSSGKPIYVQAIPMGSGDAVDEVLSGTRQTHLISPASSAFIKLGNAQSRTRNGTDLVSSTETLVLSPVVIAMWKPMAEALGWGKKPIGWSDILALTRNPQGWAAFGHPQWGKFKFGHTHPEFSNSGLISLLAEVYAATGKVSGLTLEDVAKPATASYLEGIEQSIVHYGTSTGFFNSKMLQNGPEYLSAAILYEANVIESYSPQYSLPFPVVAIYPKEGTFWSDHPVGIVERDWVTPEHREAARTYIKFLLDRPQQQKTMTYGFHPGDVNLQVGAPLDVEHGVDPKEPKTTLEVPSPAVMDAVIKLWREHKKHSNIILVFDTSGSMKEGGKMSNAKLGAKEMISLLDPRDYLSILPFSSQPIWASKDLRLDKSRDAALSQIESFFPDGGTALYDSISTAYQQLIDNPRNDSISAIVVLTDGADTNSKSTLDQLIRSLRSQSEVNAIRVFTIGYGKDAVKEVLRSIADATQAKFYEGSPENIRSVFREISTFF